MNAAEFAAALTAKFHNPEDSSPVKYVVEQGSKYAKIVRVGEKDGVVFERSSYCFIDKDGNIYKCAGWKAPAKGIRGNLSTVDMSKVDRNGAWFYRYL